ncbi:tRNA (adenosine(37)-N6)-threonylcarbamoyltransferase complex ATPase subunit type 1 TsaE [Nesterenkonia flava]|uniref:tRNA threonylcarbamoyladenosine biosynthesis protein TsaE n=1 Tax=Nesterenkonia flava TaxID=469799 RepID=A0ABU1FQH8_9MICC|nr:tRNA (adenosine(37)-N6)-threonylcarbamoyltransferase complex ATPase subunit type 1 TsaE [Nesterenkonia flava]MDR5710908.1 tRNA (adenosine(37)-N6)-threonylcarbamoyltransferase complex ATPase subunit type 1 TsaE [Nesterenkonia flava]
MTPSPADQPAEPLPGERWERRIPLTDLQETAEFARGLAAHLRGGDLLVLTGGLGAGKTTFTQSLGEALGVSGQISSPTFVLSRIHRSATQGPDLVHVDAYRTDAAGLESLDLLATLPDSVTVIEWGRGLVERALLGESGSWIDLELLATEPEAITPAVAAGESLAAHAAAPQIVTDFSETEEDLAGTPRTAVLRGYGPRWEQPPL